MTLQSQIRATSIATGANSKYVREARELQRRGELDLSLLLDTATCGCETTAELKPNKMDWPTQQPFLQQDNLGLRHYACLFFCVQFPNVLAAADRPPQPGRIARGKSRLVSLLAHVPHVQESGVGGGRNFTSSFPSCAVQSGTDFFF